MLRSTRCQPNPNRVSTKPATLRRSTSRRISTRDSGSEIRARRTTTARPESAFSIIRADTARFAIAWWQRERVVRPVRSVEGEAASCRRSVLLVARSISHAARGIVVVISTRQWEITACLAIRRHAIDDSFRAPILSHYVSTDWCTCHGLNCVTRRGPRPACGLPPFRSSPAARGARNHPCRQLRRPRMRTG